MPQPWLWEVYHSPFTLIAICVGAVIVAAIREAIETRRK